MGGKPWRFSAEKVLPLPLAQVWELLSHTEHLNRTIGLPSVVYDAPVVTADDFYRQASIKLLGLISVRWKEYPFCWVRHERYSVLRVFEGGLLERVVGEIELQESPAGTLGDAWRLLIYLVPTLLVVLLGIRGLKTLQQDQARSPPLPAKRHVFPHASCLTSSSAMLIRWASAKWPSR